MECQLQGLLDISGFPSGRESVGRDKEMAKLPGSRRRLLVESWERHLRGSELRALKDAVKFFREKWKYFQTPLLRKDLSWLVGSWAP